MGPAGQEAAVVVEPLPLFLVPPIQPRWVYTWDFGNKEVVAVVACALPWGYRPRVWTTRLRDRGK